MFFMLMWQEAVFAQPKSQTKTCTVAAAETVSFRKAGDLASGPAEVCIRITGYIYGEALHRKKAVALGTDEPGWQTIGLDGGEVDPPIQVTRMKPDAPRLATIIGYLRHCGSDNWPHYCHYVGGPIIRVEHIKFLGK
jgi:hypothetical protein